jgi:hypothetical protein
MAPYLQFNSHVGIYDMKLSESMSNNLQTDLPSKSSQTISPVLGVITSIPMLTRSSAPIPPLKFSTRHMRGGGLYRSRSSTESSSSTYLSKVHESLQWKLSAKNVTLRYGSIDVGDCTLKGRVSIVPNLLECCGLSLSNYSNPMTLR